MKHLGADILSPDFVLLVLVGNAFVRVNGEAFRNELAALAVPSFVSAFFFCKDSATGRA